MGHRLHSATKYEVKYETNGRFNWANEYVNLIIDCLAEGDAWFNNCECIECSDTCEASRDRLLTNVERIISPDPEWGNQESLDELIEELEKDKTCEVDRQYLYTELKMLVEQSDPTCSYVHFAWF